MNCYNTNQKGKNELYIYYMSESDLFNKDHVNNIGNIIR